MAIACLRQLNVLRALVLRRKSIMTFARRLDPVA